MKRICFLLVLLVTTGFRLFAQDEPQTHTLSGKVVDEHGKGLQGAYVSVQGTKESVMTDINGDFMFEVPDGEHQVVVVQAVGYGTQYLEDEGQSIIVKLLAESRMHSGPVNTAMGMKREKRETGYNSTTIDYEDLVAGGNTSVLSGLQGKVPGANITSSTNGPGGSVRVVLRGEKSLLKNNNALIVVDGVITNNYDRTSSKLAALGPGFSELAQIDFGNSDNDLNPEDIESVSVLPAAAATALYGAMGANGAIMYTTKKGKHADGKNNKMNVTFKSSFIQSDPTLYPQVQHQFGQGNIYTGNPTDRSEYRSWGYSFDDQIRPWGQVIEGKQLVKPYSDQPYNLVNFYKHGANSTNYLSVSGGSEKSTYMLSLNSVNATGVVPNTFYNRYSVRFNGSTELGHHLYSSINMNYLNTYSRVEGGGSGAGSVLNSLYNTPRDIPVWEVSDLNNKFYSQQFYDTSGAQSYGYYNGKYQNPYWVAKNYDNRNKTDRVLGDYKLGYKNGNWNVFDRVGVDAVSDRSSYIAPSYNTTPVDPSYAGMNQSSVGGYTQANYNALNLYNDLIVSYATELSRNFGMTAFAGHNMTMQRSETLAGSINSSTGGLVLPGYYNLDNTAGNVVGYNSLVRRRTVGLFTNVTFNYRKELFLELSGRNDWSSTLTNNRRSFYYPGANAAWVFTERLYGTGFKEHFMNYGKIRVSAGGTGNDGLPYANNNAGYTPVMASYNNGNVSSPFNGVNAYQISNVFGDNNLRPERTRQFETGADLGFLRDKINLSFTYYRAYTFNMIAPVPLPTSSGYSYNYINVGDVSNNGVELTLKGTPISTRYGLRWDLFATYTHNKNTVESLNGGVDHIVLGGYDGMQIVAAKGQSFGSFYAKDIAYWQDPNNGSWHAIVDPKTGLPVATSNPVYKGSYQPRFMASWGTDVSYKGLRLHAVFFTKQGSKFYSRTKEIMDANGTSQPTTVNNRNPYVWDNSVYQVPNTNIYLPNTTQFSPYAYYTSQASTVPAQNIVDGSYVRLQELSLSYKIPRKYYERSPFGGLEAGVFGNNLITWTAQSNKYDDPESTSAGSAGNGQGFNYTARPNLRNYGVYVKVNF